MSKHRRLHRERDRATKVLPGTRRFDEVHAAIYKRIEDLIAEKQQEKSEQRESFWKKLNRLGK